MLGVVLRVERPGFPSKEIDRSLRLSPTCKMTEPRSPGNQGGAGLLAFVGLDEGG